MEITQRLLPFLVAEVPVARISGAETILWHGLTVDATSVLVLYTYAGDADLSSTINGDDYFRIDSGYNSHVQGYGDFNYDGRIDADDYWLIDSNYNKAQIALPSSIVPLAASGNPQAVTSSADRDVHVIERTYELPVDATVVIEGNFTGPKST